MTAMLDAAVQAMTVEFPDLFEPEYVRRFIGRWRYAITLGLPPAAPDSATKMLQLLAHPNGLDRAVLGLAGPPPRSACGWRGFICSCARDRSISDPLCGGDWVGICVAIRRHFRPAPPPLHECDHDPETHLPLPPQGEAQYRARVDLIKARGGERLGLMTAWAWYDDPKRLTFTLARYKFVAKMLAGAGSVLEVGCSDGFASRIVAQDVKSLTAVDFDPEFIDDAKARNSDRWPVEFRLHDLTAGPVQGSSTRPMRWTCSNISRRPTRSRSCAI